MHGYEIVSRNLIIFCIRAEDPGGKLEISSIVTFIRLRMRIVRLVAVFEQKAKPVTCTLGA